MTSQSVHKNLDPVTGACCDCEATHEEIIDNLFSECLKAEGPYRIALIACRREYAKRDSHIATLAKQIQHTEDWLAKAANDLRKASAELMQLAVTLQILEEK